jgi:hypothetical protein
MIAIQELWKNPHIATTYHPECNFKACRHNITVEDWDRFGFHIPEYAASWRISW